MSEYQDWQINKMKIDKDIGDCEDCIFMKPCEWHKAIILGYQRCEEDFRTKERCVLVEKSEGEKNA